MKFVKNRIDFLFPYVKGKDVLELGCVGMGDDDSYGGINFIHKKLVKKAKNVVGLDINRKGVEQLKKFGYDVRVQDIEKRFDLKRKFDVVLVEEVIEHLSNLKVFMENVRRHLKVAGLLIITTPNAQGVSFFLQQLLLNEISGVSTKEHTHWHNLDTLINLTAKYGFCLFDCDYFQPMPIKQTWKYKIIKFFYWFLPDRVGRNIVILATKDRIYQPKRNVYVGKLE